MEAQVYRLAEILGEQRQATKDNVQRKQARTGDERDESDDENISDNDSDDDENDIPYNPKNLPLGWDGKVNINFLGHKRSLAIGSQLTVVCLCSTL